MMRKKRGFSLGEMLAVVAILIILMGLAMPGAIGVQKNVRMMRLDHNAREIFMAAQNNLTERRSSGTLETAKNAGTEDGSAQDCYWVTESSPNLTKVLPEGSIKDELLGHNLVIWYNALSGTVLEVYYSEKQTLEDYDTWKQYGTNPEQRRTDEVGFYQGDGIALPDAPVQLHPAKLSVQNGNELTLSIIVPDNARTEAGMDSTMTVTLTQLDADGNPHVTMTRAGGIASGQVVLPSEIVPVDGTPVTYTLDSIFHKAGQERARFADVTENMITPGANIRVEVKLEKKHKDANNPQDFIDSTAVIVTNSLFAVRENVTAEIRCARHLQNLDKTYSGLNESITTAKQTQDVVWPSDPGRWPGDGSQGEWPTGMVSDPFQSIDHPKLTTYDGQQFEIRDLIGLGGGLFNMANSMTLNGIRLVDPVIRCNGGTAGALANTTADITTISDCRVYGSTEGDGLSNPPANLGVFVTGDNCWAGGLVGSASGTTIQHSFAALPVLKSDTGVGGLVGLAGKNVKITSCYADIGLHQKGASADEWSWQSGMEVPETTGKAGGLVGQCNETTNVVQLINSYGVGYSNLNGNVGLCSGNFTADHCYWAVDMGEDGQSCGYQLAPTEKPVKASLSQLKKLEPKLPRFFHSNDVETHPYSGACIAPYLWPTLKDGRGIPIPHYGDWPTQEREVPDLSVIIQNITISQSDKQLLNQDNPVKMKVTPLPKEDLRLKLTPGVAPEAPEELTYQWTVLYPDRTTTMEGTDRVSTLTIPAAEVQDGKYEIRLECSYPNGDQTLTWYDTVVLWVERQTNQDQTGHDDILNVFYTYDITGAQGERTYKTPVRLEQKGYREVLFSGRVDGVKDQRVDWYLINADGTTGELLTGRQTPVAVDCVADGTTYKAAVLTWNADQYPERGGAILVRAAADSTALNELSLQLRAMARDSRNNPNRQYKDVEVVIHQDQTLTLTPKDPSVAWVKTNITEKKNGKKYIKFTAEQTFTVDPAGTNLQWSVDGQNVAGASGHTYTYTAEAWVEWAEKIKDQEPPKKQIVEVQVTDGTHLATSLLTIYPTQEDLEHNKDRYEEYNPVNPQIDPDKEEGGFHIEVDGDVDVWWDKEDKEPIIIAKPGDSFTIKPGFDPNLLPDGKIPGLDLETKGEYDPDEKDGYFVADKNNPNHYTGYGEYDGVGLVVNKDGSITVTVTKPIIDYDDNELEDLELEWEEGEIDPDLEIYVYGTGFSESEITVNVGQKISVDYLWAFLPEDKIGNTTFTLTPDDGHVRIFEKVGDQLTPLGNVIGAPEPPDTQTTLVVEGMEVTEKGQPIILKAVTDVNGTKYPAELKINVVSTEKGKLTIAACTKTDQLALETAGYSVSGRTVPLTPYAKYRNGEFYPTLFSHEKYAAKNFNTLYLKVNMSDMTGNSAKNITGMTITGLDVSLLSYTPKCQTDGNSGYLELKAIAGYENVQDITFTVNAFAEDGSTAAETYTVRVCSAPTMTISAASDNVTNKTITVQNYDFATAMTQVYTASMYPRMLEVDYRGTHGPDDFEQINWTLTDQGNITPEDAVQCVPNGDVLTVTVSEFPSRRLRFYATAEYLPDDYLGSAYTALYFEKPAKQ